MGFLWLPGASVASADPINITAGFLYATIARPTSVASLVGTQGFSLESRVSPEEGNVQTFVDCPCLPGAPVGISAQLSGLAFFSGEVTLGGESYTDLGGGPADPHGGLFLRIVGPLLVAPPFQNAPTTITGPFTVRGSLSLPFPHVFQEVLGSGVATVLLRPDPGNLWVTGSVHYGFTNETPVPEPATLALVGGGLLAIAHARRSRRRKSSVDVHH
jgi:hypothetical protein